MGKYTIKIERRAIKELQAHQKSGNKTIIKRIEQIFDELAEHPETGIGQPEQLRYQLSGYWSRRISSEHRIIYRIDEDIIEVLVISAYGHYE